MAQASFFELKEFFKDGNLEISDIGVKNMYDLCDIVIHKHFSYTDKQTREDLVSTGMLKMMELLSQNKFDPTRSSLKNYLYTGVRNEMKNYLYRTSKDVTVDDEILIGMNEAPDTNVNLGLLVIPSVEIISVSHRLRLTSDDVKKIESSLRHMGFNNGSEESPYFSEVESAVALIVWRHLEKERR